MIRRVMVWVVAGAAFGVLSLIAIHLPGGITATPEGHLGLFWSLFAAVVALDVTVLRRIARKPAGGQP